MNEKIKIDEITDNDYVGVRIDNRKYKIDKNDVKGGFSLFRINELIPFEHLWVRDTKIAALKYVSTLRRDSKDIEGKWFRDEKSLETWLKLI